MILRYKPGFKWTRLLLCKMGLHFVALCGGIDQHILVYDCGMEETCLI